MAYLLDTSIAIHAYEGTGRVLDKLLQNRGTILISTLCLAELKRGLYSHPALATESSLRLDKLLEPFPVLPFDRHAVDAYESIIARLGFSRSRDFDRMIAAHALSLSAVLVTDNEADFTGIPGLVLENWTAA